jgi:hypothetical protein
MSLGIDDDAIALLLVRGRRMHEPRRWRSDHGAVVLGGRHRVVDRAARMHDREPIANRAWRATIDLACDTGLEHGLVISPTVLPWETYARWLEQERPLLMDVQTQGIPCDRGGS